VSGGVCDLQRSGYRCAHVSESSKPITFRFVRRPASSVVPLPRHESSTVSASLEYVRIRYSNNATGFWVGWVLLSRLLLAIVMTLVGYLVP
jgi:hypothetical protein